MINEKNAYNIQLTDYAGFRNFDTFVHFKNFRASWYVSAIKILKASTTAIVFRYSQLKKHDNYDTMNYQDKTKEELIQDLLNLQQKYNSIVELNKKVVGDSQLVEKDLKKSQL